MITDKLLRVSEDQALTTTAVSTDTIDLSVARDIGEGEDLAGEAVESTPAPEATAKLQSKGNMNTKAVKVVKKAVSSASSGQENGGKPKNAPTSTLGPKMSFKSNGSGAAVDGRNVSAFE